MRFSLSWIQDFFDTPLSAQQIEKELTLIGLEVDGVEKLTPNFEGLIVADVREVQPHPDADRLSIATVFTGTEELQVVCGAKNCRKGLRSAFAPIGSKIRDSEGKVHTIKKGKLRGVESNGMLASAQEMGLQEESDGIIEFSSELKAGEELTPFFEDTVFEISFTPNLGHAMSHYGIARELAPLIDERPLLKKFSLKESSETKIEKKLTLVIEDEEGCPTYACRLIEGVKVGPSPFWLQQKLRAAGHKSINNVVDVTNYILLEMGHPLHAFDFDKVEGAQIRVISTSKKVTLVTLDQVSREVPINSLLICDAVKPLAIAGIMGGSNSQVENETVNILLEAAIFNPSLIRKTSKTLALHTEASKHFERGVDPHAPLIALERAAALIQQLAGGKIAKGSLSSNFEKKASKNLTCRVEFVNRLLGTSISPKEMFSLFEKMGFEPSLKEALIHVIIPSYRNDLSVEIDLVEEIARYYGLDRIGKKAPKATLTEMPDCDLALFERKVHQSLLREGLQEILTCDLISPQMSLLNGKSSNPISTLNSVSIDQSILRSSLLANHLDILRRNQSHQNIDLHFYEIGKIYSKDGDCFKEESVIALSLMGAPFPYHFEKPKEKIDFFHLKGIVENLLSSLYIQNLVFHRSHNPLFHPGIQAELLYEGQIVGVMGEIHPSILRGQNLKHAVFFAEMSLPSLMVLSKPLEKIEELSPFPSSERDWTLTCLEDLEVGHLIHCVKTLDSRLLKDVFLLDLYRSESIGTDRKNVTLRFVYRNDKKTISFEATEIEHAKITSQVLEKMKTLIIQPL